MSTIARPKPLFTLRTDELAGRQDELRKLGKTLEELQSTSDKTLLLYIAGDGGMGKTRFLQWVYKQYEKRELSSKIFCTSILDLANSILRTDIDLVERIFDDIELQLTALPESLLDSFESYKAIRDRYQLQRSGAAATQASTEVINAFYEGWLPLAQAGYRLIVLLDTAELLRFEDDPVRQQFEKYGANMPTSSTKSWLEEVVKDSVETVDRTLPGVLFIVAGRVKEDETLYKNLCALANLIAPAPEDRIINLSGLSRSGVDEYLEALANKLDSEEYFEQSRQIREDVDPTLRDALYQLTEGSPIALATVLQIYIDQPVKELEDLINMQLLSPNTTLPNVEKRLQKALVTTLAEQQTFGATSIAIQYMSLARKGLTRDRLAYLVPKETAIDFDAVFNDLRRLIFVKELSNDILVLHDKVADWTQEGLYGVTTARYRKFNQRLVEMYHQEIEKVDKEIERLSPKADPIEGEEGWTESEPSTLLKDPPSAFYTKEFRELRRYRRNLLVERMSYALRADPVLGYKQYFELSEEAFNVGRMDYESQIRTEFLSWWNFQDPPKSGLHKYRQQALAAGMDEKIINADFALRVVQREYNRFSPDTTRAERMRHIVSLVENILKQTIEKQFTPPRFAEILLAVYSDTASGHLAQKEEDIESVRKSFGGHIRELEQLYETSTSEKPDIYEPNEFSLQTFLILNALAFAYYEQGFFERNHGNHGSAIKSYTRSLFPYRELKFEINQARSLNDKAYVLAMVGDSDSAETAIQDALNLRRRLGFSFLIALSYNTLGIVRTMGERPITAVLYCDYALRIFQELGHDFGQMIAYRALSEAYRRSAEYAQYDQTRQLQLMDHALEASKAAYILAKKLLTEEDFQFADLLDECGCAYRDLARFRFANNDLISDRYQDAYEKSKSSFEQAIQIASRLPSAHNHQVDSMINLAYLCFYQIFQEKLDTNRKTEILIEAERLIIEAIDTVPERYRSPQHAENRQGEISIYWAYLSKAYALRVHILRTQLEELGTSPDTLVEQQQLENKLLRQSIYTLYFRSKLKSNVRNGRKSHQAVYEAFQTLSATTCRRLHRIAHAMSDELGINSSIIEEFLEDDFGLAGR